MISFDEKHRVLKDNHCIGSIVYDEQGFRFAPMMGTLLDEATMQAICKELIRRGYYGYVSA